AHDRLRQRVLQRDLTQLREARIREHERAQRTVAADLRDERRVVLLREVVLAAQREDLATGAQVVVELAVARLHVDQRIERELVPEPQARRDRALERRRRA